MDKDKTIGIVGTGVIGAGWAVRALSRGHDVIAWDPADGAEDRLRQSVERNWQSASRLGLFPGASPDRITWADTPEQVAATAESCFTTEDMRFVITPCRYLPTPFDQLHGAGSSIRVVVDAS